MIEMLAVLAIIGVLSVGGIAGYYKAMTKWKINKTISDYTYFMFKSIEYQNDLYKLPEDTGLANIAQSLGMLPESWIYINSKWVEDALKHRIQMWTNSSNLIFEIFSVEEDKQFCQEIFNNFAKPLSSFLVYTYIWRSKASSSVHFYGDSYCGEGKKCLKDITNSEIDSLCGVILDKNDGSASIVFRY